MAETPEMQAIKEEESVSLRKSSRDRKKKRSFSPEVNFPASPGRRKRGGVPRQAASGSRSRDHHQRDQLLNGAQSEIKFELHVDGTVGVGLSQSRPKKPRKVEPAPSEEDKQAYLRQMQEFCKQLSEELADSDAELLYCPSFNKKPCGCIQRYLSAEGSVSLSRARQLLALLKQARDLKVKKCYSLPDATKKARRGSIGLGNGHKHSPEYTRMVLDQRAILKDQWQLCERACQRLLGYSNNFLHKPLKTERDERRAARLRGKAGLGLLPEIERLATENCCTNICTTMALTHASLLQQWRDRASRGQAAARRVLAEMLTPSGGHFSNCYKFISLVTGCSLSTIGSVNEQMRTTSGEREPPEHGLKRYFKENPHKRRIKTTSSNTNGIPSVDSVSAEQCSQLDHEQLSATSSSKISRQDITGHEKPTVGGASGLIASLRQKIAEQEAQLASQQQLIQQWIQPTQRVQPVLGNAKPTTISTVGQTVEHFQVCSVSPQPDSSQEATDTTGAIPLLVVERAPTDLPGVMAFQLVTPAGTALPHVFSAATSAAGSAVAIETVSVSTALHGDGSPVLNHLNADHMEEIVTSVASDLPGLSQDLFAPSSMVAGSKDIYGGRTLLQSICDVGQKSDEPPLVSGTPSPDPGGSDSVSATDRPHSPAAAPAYSSALTASHSPPTASSTAPTPTPTGLPLLSDPDQTSPSLPESVRSPESCLQLLTKLDGEDSTMVVTMPLPLLHTDLGTTRIEASSLMDLLRQPPVPAFAAAAAVQPKDCSEQGSVECPSPTPVSTVTLEVATSPTLDTASLDSTALLSLPSQTPEDGTL